MRRAGPSLLWFGSLVVGFCLTGWAVDPALSAAEYYLARHDFKQALPLWVEVLRRQPENAVAATHVAELKLLIEGRASSRQALSSFIETAGVTLSWESRRLLKERLGQLQSAFLTDEGQSVYLQAVPKLRAKDCQGALPLLVQSAALEKGNARVLREKARCEKAMGLLEPYYQSLEAAALANPYDPELIDHLLESHLYFRAPEKAVAVVKRDPEVLRTNRQRTAYAAALVDTAAAGEALLLVHGLLEQAKQGGLHPIVYWVAGRALALRNEGQMAAIPYLERFLSAAARPENTKIDGWDPYHSAERIETAQKLLATLKGS